MSSVRGLGIDLTGNESTKVGRLPNRGRVRIEYDLRESAGTFEIHGLYDFLPWAKGSAYDSPRFKVEDLKDLQLLLFELEALAGKQKGISFEQRLATGHYGSLLRQKSFIPDALDELALPAEQRPRAHEMLKVAMTSANGDVKRAWVLLKAMVGAAGLRSALPAATEPDSLDGLPDGPSAVDTTPS